MIDQRKCIRFVQPNFQTFGRKCLVSSQCFLAGHYDPQHYVIYSVFIQAFHYKLPAMLGKIVHFHSVFIQATDYLWCPIHQVITSSNEHYKLASNKGFTVDRPLEKASDLYSQTFKHWKKMCCVHSVFMQAIHNTMSFTVFSYRPFIKNWLLHNHSVFIQASDYPWCPIYPVMNTSNKHYKLGSNKGFTVDSLLNMYQICTARLSNIKRKFLVSSQSFHAGHCDPQHYVINSVFIQAFHKKFPAMLDKILHIYSVFIQATDYL